ncbi:MAG: hypothetical protein CSA62_10985 [Planctomycetota bacterium]|nr:MAG: hypothetical protein CSA62_10985 [Planctomycetota bacterium]
MDLNDLWQEHKTWILGIVAGLILFLACNSVIGGSFGTEKLKRAMAGHQRSVASSKMYGQEEERQARKLSKELEQRLLSLQQRSYFDPQDRYLLEGKGDYSTHYLTVTSEDEIEMRRAMNTANVDFLAARLGLPASSPTERDEVQRMLLGLDLVTDALTRLLAASDEVLTQLPGQHGLRAVDKIQIEAAPRKRNRSSRGSKAPVQLGEEVTVRLVFRSDSVTVERWLERLLGERALPSSGDEDEVSEAEGGEAEAEHQGPRPILLKSLQVEDVGRESGEPLKVSVTLLALIAKES